MTLSRRLFLKNALLLVSLVLLGAVALRGLVDLRSDLRVIGDEYAELRIIQRVGVNAASAKALLQHPNADHSGVVGDLVKLTADLQDFITRQDEDSDEPTEHNLHERQQGQLALARLNRVIDDLKSPSPVGGDEMKPIDEFLVGLNQLVVDMDTQVKSTQKAAGKDLHFTIILIGALTGVIFLVAVAVSLSHYRALLAPLHQLRDGVRRIAARQFSGLLPVSGDAEFASLAVEFNRMASELDAFYRLLEEKVELKSRELVRSERLASVGFLAAGVAHEINNPLSIISGHAELMLKRLARAGGEASEMTRLRNQLQIILDEAFRCKEITDKLLSLSRPGRGDREKVSLAQVASDTAMTIQALRAHKGRRIQVETGDDAFDVLAKEGEMKQVLLNLTINALEATPVDGTITIAGRRSSNGDVELAVSDTGRGMSPEVIRRVFEPFFTEKRGTGAPGTGLGLSITHAIIEAHGGSIRAESDGIGRGSSFTIHLPAYLSPAQADRLPAIVSA